ncbi:MAG TPA: class II glutamine amidotransferase [Solirubrobacteraceae bacterium]|nr:class II glutamine amidotransferase [Solirubrobacteraceae bacterium]
MCRWMAWSGQPVIIDDLLFQPKHGLVDQSLHSKLGAETTNGDGFGLGWYGEGDGPARYRSVKPAWGDDNLREIAKHVTSPLFISHVRATSGTAVQESNCHPFRHGKWLFVHNGVVEGMHQMRRELMLQVAPELFSEIEGSTDSEVLFHLGLTFGLEEDPLGAMERTIGLVEATARTHGIQNAVQASIGIADGERLWAIRYSTEGRSRTLFHSAEPDTVRALYGEDPRLGRVREEDRLVVSEPFSDLPGLWVEIPEATALIVQPGEDAQVPFQPRVDEAVNGRHPAGAA